MKGLARAVVMGNLTADPEMRSTQGGTSVCTFSVAVNGRVKRQGEWEDYASFFDVTCFGSQAESVTQYLTKGAPVAVDGRLQQDRWQAKDGGNRSAVKIIADAVNFLPSGEKREDQGQRFQPTTDVPSDAETGADHPFDDPDPTPAHQREDFGF